MDLSGPAAIDGLRLEMADLTSLMVKPVRLPFATSSV